AVAHTFVVGILGEQWVEIVPLLRVLCIAGFATSVVTLTGSVYLSQGAAKLQWRVSLVTRPLAVIAIVIGVQWGVIGVAIGSVIATWINTMITLSAAGGLIDLRLAVFFRGLFKAWVASVLMGSVVYAISLPLTEVSTLLVLLMQILVGVICYVGAVFVLRVPQAAELLAMLKSRMHRRRLS